MASAMCCRDVPWRVSTGFCVQKNPSYLMGQNTSRGTVVSIVTEEPSRQPH